METKKVKILTPGVLPAKAFIYGPVLTPYHEKIDIIFQLIANGVDVVEVTDDGREVKLTVANFDKDLSKTASDAEKKAAAEKREADAKAAEVRDMKRASERVAKENKKKNKGNSFMKVETPAVEEKKEEAVVAEIVADVGEPK